MAEKAFLYILSILSYTFTSTWTMQNQLTEAQPVSEGMGMFLMQKMGWRTGDGLGKNNEGIVKPIQINVKLKTDKKGLVSNEEIPVSKKNINTEKGIHHLNVQNANDFQHQFPISNGQSGNETTQSQPTESTPISLSAQSPIEYKSTIVSQHESVSFGMGMTLLQKMGWKPGEGLGKNKNTNLVPIEVKVKNNKRGLLSIHDIVPHKRGKNKCTVKGKYHLTGKHPVMLLGEYCTKLNLGIPIYELCYESGPSHRKNFTFKVKVNGIEYQPNNKYPSKKEAKAEAAQMCLQALGLEIS